MEHTYMGKVLMLLDVYQKSYRLLADCSNCIDNLFAETEGIESKLKLLMTLDESVKLYPKMRNVDDHTERNMTFSEYQEYCGYILKGMDWFSNYLESAFTDLQGWMDEYILKYDLIYEYINCPGDYEDTIRFESELIQLRRILEYSNKLLSTLIFNNRAFLDMLRKYFNDMTLA